MRLRDALAGNVDLKDAQILAAHALSKDKTWIIAHADDDIDAGAARTIGAMLRRREAGEPVQYITGVAHFYGREFLCDARGLIPRPATESLVEDAIAVVQKRNRMLSHREVDASISILSAFWGGEPRTIVDAGTGSGCIAITLALELPTMRVIATDVSVKALQLALANCEKHSVEERVDLRSGSLLDPVRDERSPFLLVSNPPYVPDSYALPASVEAYEPASALKAGPDGLGVLRPLCEAAVAHPQCVGVVLECRTDQTDAVSAILTRRVATDPRPT